MKFKLCNLKVNKINLRTFLTVYALCRPFVPAWIFNIKHFRDQTFVTA